MKINTPEMKGLIVWWSTVSTPERSRSTDTPDLKEKEKVYQLQQNVMRCLEEYEKNRYPNKPMRLGKLLLCLPTLRTYSETALENYVTLEFFGKLDMPPLVAELLE